MPPAEICGGSAAGLGFSLIGPVTVSIAGYVRWFYFLSRGPTSHRALKEAFNGTSFLIMKGYKLTLPGLEDLKRLFESGGSDVVKAAPGGLANHLWRHFWTATAKDSGHSWAVKVRLDGRDPMEYVAPEDQLKLAMLEVSEAYTVTHGVVSMQRRELISGMPCCFEVDSRTLEGVPLEVEGATFFAIGGSSGDHRKGGVFAVVSTVPVTVFALAVVDPYRRHGHLYDSGFEDLGWSQVPAPDLLISPWGLPMNCWKIDLAAWKPLKVPHRGGLYGSLAVSALKS